MACVSQKKKRKKSTQLRADAALLLHPVVVVGAIGFRSLNLKIKTCHVR